MTKYFSANTGEYPRMFPNFQNCACCEKDLKDSKHSSIQLARKNARIFVLGHCLFFEFEAHSFTRGKLFVARKDRTTRININRININPNDYYNPVIDYYNSVIDYYNPLLWFEPCLNQLGLILIRLILILILDSVIDYYNP